MKGGRRKKIRRRGGTEETKRGKSVQTVRNSIEKKKKLVLSEEY